MSHLTQTPIKTGINVPIGHLIVNPKWKNSDLSTTLQSSIQVLYDDNLGMVDFYPSPNTGVVYITEAELVSNSYRRRLAKLRKANKIPIVVIGERTGTSSQYFCPLQKFCVMELGFSLIPVPSQKEAGTFLAQMVHVEGHKEANPFTRKKRSAPLDQALLASVKSIPKLGEVKSRMLLEKFGSLHAISKASIQELTTVVGKASAEHIRTFLGNPS
ncbi:Fanconi anemia core complex-associated protein 24-like [Mytilus californianus]|uniref:Fanconi anemia core complex-associated protein 24-like n=1 Tax=Mytilus californianus TaxID=6549 RepID=UPI0022480A50|nr:Fanconi anemia core complex-associated protein 24-like [Mytilus californianus]XP_052070468.1 Fanconi anemia core complex-associated protein 24-like [Mytilus californianus]